jgi:poly(3-hydroxybutyrate) depolymerase
MQSIARCLDLCLSRSLRPAYVTAALLTATVLACGSPSETSTGTSRDRLGGAPALDIDATETSVSGLSSGAFMAVQFHVAFSATMKGVAAFAGGPFRCAQGSVSDALTKCMSSSSKLDPAPFVATTKSYAASGAVDGVEHLKGQRVFLFGGAKDTTVNPAVMDGLRDYYASFVDTADIAFERQRTNTAHTMPTETYGGACGTTASPYVGNCGYDGAGAALAHIYGPLTARPASLSGDFVAIAQGDFIASPATHSLADTAYAYVPQSCAAGERCKIHVAFHGCKQSTSEVGDAFYKHAGYAEWADTNHIVVLYPQTITKQGNNGCWDWWGYDSPDYAKKTGPQMTMVKAMVDGLASGAAIGAGAAAPPPADAGAPPPSDAGASDAAPEASGTTSCVLSSNADHVAAGRARSSFGFAFAAGSNQGLGLANALVWTSLVRRSPGVYVAGVCP